MSKDWIWFVSDVANLSLETLTKVARNPSEIKEIVKAFRMELLKLLEISDVSDTPAFKPLYSRIDLLNSFQYAIPWGLAEVHKEVIEQLSSSQWNSSFSFSWLLLHWKPWTWKSEYPRFLWWLLSDSIIVFTIDCAKIRNDSSPASKLSDIYHELQTIAKREWKYVICFLDEFDIFMTPHSTIETTSTLNDYRTSGSSSSSSIVTSKMTVDDVWSQLFATLKHLMSGSWDHNRVFTVATTNVEAIPDALSRYGRFRDVLLSSPFNLPSMYSSQDYISEYIDYRPFIDFIIYIIEIFSATHCRLHYLSMQPREFEDLIKNVYEARDKIKRIIPKNSKASSNGKLTTDQMEEIVWHIITFLEISDSDIKNRLLKSVKSYHPIHSFKALQEKLDLLNQSYIAAYYKTINMEKIPDITLIKQTISEMLFSKIGKLF